MSKKLITVLTLGAFLAGGALAPLVANAVEADPWEKAANEFLEKNENKPATPKAETPKAETLILQQELKKKLKRMNI